MISKTKEEMKKIMKKIARQQVGSFIPGQNGWPEHVDNCIAAEICPECGSDIFTNEELDGSRGRVKLTCSECSTCDWKKFD